MGLWLKQSVAITVKIGPFIDDGDGKTAEVALTLTQADIRLSKNGGNIAQKNEANDATTDELGYYDCPLDGTDTGTLGVLQLFVHEAGALPVFHEYMVVPANVWDSLFGADKLDVNMAELANIDFGATMKTSLETAVDNGLDNAIPGVPTANSINEIAGALSDRLPSDFIMGSSVSTAKDDEIDAILADTNELQTDWHNGGRLDLLLDEAITDIIAVDGKVDLIKAVTDTLTLAAIADAVHDEVTEGATTLRQSIRIMLAALAGKSNGGGTNDIRFRNQADTTDRIRATVDVNGNRTAMAYDP